MWEGEIKSLIEKNTKSTVGKRAVIALNSWAKEDQKSGLGRRSKSRWQVSVKWRRRGDRFLDEKKKSESKQVEGVRVKYSAFPRGEGRCPC